jgi:hypothetical protein
MLLFVARGNGKLSREALASVRKDHEKFRTEIAGTEIDRGPLT